MTVYNWNNEDPENKKISIFSHLQEHKTFYIIRIWKNTGNMENIHTCIIWLLIWIIFALA